MLEMILRILVTMDTCRCLLLLATLSAACCQQVFLTEPADSETIQGGTQILTCSVDNLQGAVQWARDGFALGFAGPDGKLQGFPRYTMIGARDADPAGVPNGTYNMMISNAQLEDDGNFQCQVGATESSAGMMSRLAKHSVLIPPDKPSIENGTIVEVVADSPVNLTCHADNGKPAPNITWWSGGVELSSIDVVSTASMHTDGKRENVVSLLEISPRKLDQGRVYECRALNPALQQNPLITKAQLEVLYPPVVTLALESGRKVKEGESIKFRCDFSANPDQVTWKWYTAEEELVGEVSNRLLLSDVTRDLHTKQVKCEATNKVGAAQKTYTLNIEYGPRFKTGPMHQAVDVGGDASLMCDVDANPEPAIYWKRKTGNKILSTSTTLNLHDVTDGDFGIYTCTASSVGFGDFSMDVHLLKNGPPRVVSEKEQSAKFGDIANVECVIESAPKPTSIVWSKNGVVLDPKNMPRRYAISTTDLPEGVRSIVEIKSVQQGDFATYNCSVENGYGHAQLQITFTEREVIPLAYILSAVLVGVVILIAIGVVVFIYLKRRNSGSESGSESSEDSLQKRDDNKNETKPETSGYPIDAWRTDNFGGDQKPYRYSAEYDELNYQNKDPGQRMNKSYDYGDGYAGDGYAGPGYGDPRRAAAGEYGTYPGPARIYDNRFSQENPYGPLSVPGGSTYQENPYGGSTYAPSVHSEYGTYRGPPPSNHGDYPPSNRLATNV